MSTQTVIDRPDSNEQIDAQQVNEKPKEDLGYLKLKRWFDEFLPCIRDEKRHPLDRLREIDALLRPCDIEPYKERLAVEIAELTAMRDEIKRSLNVL